MQLFTSNKINSIVWFVGTHHYDDGRIYYTHKEDKCYDKLKVNNNAVASNNNGNILQLLLFPHIGSGCYYYFYE